MNAMDRIGIEAASCNTSPRNAARRTVHIAQSQTASAAAPSSPTSSRKHASVSSASRSSNGNNSIPKQSPVVFKVPSDRSLHTKAIGNWQALVDEGFTKGLAMALASNSEFAWRTWIIDNSGSMLIGDGHRIVETADRRIEGQDVTRWEELQQAVLYHVDLASILMSPTNFQLLNHPGERIGRSEFTVGNHGANKRMEDIIVAKSVIQRTHPSGVTPLTEHVVRIEKQIRDKIGHLSATGQRVAVVIATDGLPTDAKGDESDEVRSEFVHALKRMEDLPVWLVIRLCTDEPKVCAFYNQLDTLLEMSLDVLDDFIGEAKEVHGYNKWLTYGLPLQRCRELGFHHPVFDMIDERKLELGELRPFCGLLFGSNPKSIPDPQTHWKDFMAYVEEALKTERLQWNPITEKMAPWINLKALHKAYGKGKCTIM